MGSDRPGLHYLPIRSWVTGVQPPPTSACSASAPPARSTASAGSRRPTAVTNQAELSSLTRAVSPSATTTPAAVSPVVADDELPDADDGGVHPRHASAACTVPTGDGGARKSRAKREREAKDRRHQHEQGRIPAGPARLRPLGAPEDPEGGQHHPHAELHRVLRDPRQRGADRDADRRDDQHGGGRAAAAASPTRCWLAPKVRAMKTTSRPSSRTPLKAIVNE